MHHEYLDPDGTNITTAGIAKNYQHSQTATKNKEDLTPMENSNSKSLKNITTSSTRATNYTVVLYPWAEEEGGDPIHVRADDFIRSQLTDYMIYMDHKGEPLTDDPNKIGKKHRHYILNFPNARFWSAVLKSCGYPDGERWIRPMVGRETLRDGLLYLTHVKFPWKTQYEPKDAVGAAHLKRLLEQYYYEYISQGIPIQSQFNAIFDWIETQDHYVTFIDFGRWIAGTSYYKLASNPLVIRVLTEHNKQYGGTGSVLY